MIRQGAQTHVKDWENEASPWAPLLSGDEILVGRQSFFERNAIAVITGVSVLASRRSGAPRVADGGWCCSGSRTGSRRGARGKESALGERSVDDGAGVALAENAAVAVGPCGAAGSTVRTRP